MDAIIASGLTPHVLRRNVKQIKVLSGLNMFSPLVPLLQMRLSEELSQTQIGTVLLVPWLVIVLTDLITGRLADVYSYKALMIASCVFTATQYVVMLAAPSLPSPFWGYMAAAALWGLGLSCWRGAPSSLGALSTAQLEAIEPPGKPVNDGYRRLSVWIAISAGAGEAIASACAGVAMLALNIETVIWASLAISLIMMAVTIWGIHEIRPDNTARIPLRQAVFSGWGDTRREMVDALRSNPPLLQVLVCGAVLGCATQPMVWLTLVYLQGASLTPAETSFTWSGYHVVLAILGMIVMSLALKHFSTALVALPFIAVSTYLLLAFVPSTTAGIVIVLGFYLIRAVQMPVIDIKRTSLAPPRVRSTTVALMSSMGFIMYCIMNPILHACVEYFPHFGPHATSMAFLVATATLGTAAFAAVWWLRRAEKRVARTLQTS